MDKLFKVVLLLIGLILFSYNVNGIETSLRVASVHFTDMHRIQYGAGPLIINRTNSDIEFRSTCNREIDPWGNFVRWLPPTKSIITSNSSLLGISKGCYWMGEGKNSGGASVRPWDGMNGFIIIKDAGLALRFNLYKEFYVNITDLYLDIQYEKNWSVSEYTSDATNNIFTSTGINNKKYKVRISSCTSSEQEDLSPNRLGIITIEESSGAKI